MRYHYLAEIKDGDVCRIIKEMDAPCNRCRDWGERRGNLYWAHVLSVDVAAAAKAARLLHATQGTTF